MLSMVLGEEGEENWEVALPAVMLAYCSSPLQTTHQSPFMLTFGREVRLPVDVMFGRPVVCPVDSTSSQSIIPQDQLDTNVESRMSTNNCLNVNGTVLLLWVDFKFYISISVNLVIK